MRNLLSTLGTISKINPGDKLIVKNRNITIDNRWIQWYRRKLDGESRYSTISFLEELYTEIKDKVNSIINNLNNSSTDDNYKILKSVANAIGKSYTGIKNLIITYDNDSSIVSKLEFIIEIDIIETYIKIKKILPKEFLPDKFIFDKNKIEECSVNVN